LYRSKFGVWPSVNLASPITKVKVDPNFKQRTPEEIMKYVFTEVRYKTDLDEISRTTGLSYFYCHNFNYEEDKYMTINLSGQEIDGIADDNMYKEWLEYNIKNV
jgi:hypothetical protein